MNLAELVKRRRENLGLSMKELAAASGDAVKATTVCDIENETTRNVTASTILGLAKAMKVQPAIVLEAARISLTPEKVG